MRQAAWLNPEPAAEGHPVASPWTPELDTRLKTLVEAGWPWPEIGRRLGVSRESAETRARRLNLTRKLPVRTIPTLAELVPLHWQDE